jgi:hypothetical protein
MEKFPNKLREIPIPDIFTDFGKRFDLGFEDEVVFEIPIVKAPRKDLILIASIERILVMLDNA